MRQDPKIVDTEETQESVAATSIETIDSSDKNKDETRHVVFESKSDEPTLEGDYGQSNPEDKNMYSTRS